MLSNKFNYLLYLTVYVTSSNALFDSCESVNKFDCDCYVSPFGKKSVWLFCPKNLEPTNSKLGHSTKNIKHKIFIDFYKDYNFLDIYCNFNDYDGFEYIPEFRLNTKYISGGANNGTQSVFYAEHLNFGNCFNNNVNRTSNNTNNNINLFDFLSNLNLNYKQRLIIHSSSYMVFDETQFFAGFNLSVIKYLSFDYIGFNSTQFLHNLTNMKYLNLYNSKLIDFDYINGESNKVEIIKILNTQILNFNTRNFAKLKILKYFHLINCKFNRDGIFNFIRFARNELVEMRIINSTEYGTNELRLRDRIFDNLTKLEILFVKYENLAELPRNIFNQLSSLRILDLSHNKLFYLDRTIFEHNPQLELIDLRNNEFETIDLKIFETLNHLGQLHLEGNRLTQFKYDALNQPQLRLINLKNNSLTFANITECPINSNISNSITVDLQTNLIENLQSIACLINNPGISKLNLTNNKLTEFPIRSLIKNDLLRHKHNMALILDGNNINITDMPIGTIMEEEDYLSYFNPYFYNLIIDFNDCPIYCEHCMNLRSLPYLSKFFHDFGIEIKLNSPIYCRKSVYCNMVDFYDLIDKPPICEYMHNMFTKKMIINCDNKNLTEIPFISVYISIEYTEIELNLQNNFIKKLHFDYGQNGNIISKITKINLANNSLEDIDFKARFPIKLNSLNLSNNPALVNISEDTINLWNLVGYKLNVTISNGNRALCTSFASVHYEFNLRGMHDCGYYDKPYVIKSIVQTLPKQTKIIEDHYAPVMKQTIIYYKSNRHSSNYFVENVLHLKFLFTLTVIVVIIIVIIYLYYNFSMKCRLLRRFRFSNRTGNIELKENLLGDNNAET